MNKILIRNASVIAGDGAPVVLENHDLLVDGTRIAAIGRNLEVSDAMVIEAEGKIVMPGLVDTHRHLWQTCLRGLCANHSILQYVQAFHLGYGAAHRPEDVYLATYIGAIEAMASGVTTIADHAHVVQSPQHAEAIWSGLADAGLRSVMLFSLYDAATEARVFPDHASRMRHARDFHARHDGQSGGLMQFGLALNEPADTTDEIFRLEFELAREWGAPISSHVGNVSGKGRITRLQQLGLLGPDAFFVHCNQSTEEELQMLADAGCGISITPETELAMGIGIPVTGRVIAKGMKPSIGVDIVSFNSGDLLEQARLAVQLQRGLNNEVIFASGRIPQAITPSVEDAFMFATANGASTLRMSAEVGTLAVGKQADIVIMTTEGIGHMPPATPIVSIILQSRPADIQSVLIAGRFRKRDGVVLDVDLTGLRAKAIATQQELHARAARIGEIKTSAAQTFSRMVDETRAR